MDKEYLCVCERERVYTSEFEKIVESIEKESARKELELAKSNTVISSLLVLFFRC